MRKIFKDGELTFLVLKALSRSSLGVDNLVDRILTPGFGHKGQFTRSQFIAYKKRCRERAREYAHEEFLLKEKIKIATLINRLQKAGLVKKENFKKGSWSVTKGGLSRILYLEEKLFNNKKTLPEKNYPLLKAKSLMIIIFDISEKERRKREWLRQVLKRLEFKMLQKSVWIGNNLIPPDFIKDLQKINILNQVKIFSVVETGNIQESLSS